MQTTSREYQKRLEPKELLELLGLAAQKRKTKNTEANIQYFEKLSEIIKKYGMEVMGDAKTN